MVAETKYAIDFFQISSTTSPNDSHVGLIRPNSPRQNFIISSVNQWVSVSV